MSYDKTISADLYDQKWEDGTITITMKRGASVPVIIIKVTGAELTGSYTLSVKDVYKRQQEGLVLVENREWTMAKAEV